MSSLASNWIALGSLVIARQLEMSSALGARVKHFKMLVTSYPVHGHIAVPGVSAASTVVAANHLC